MVTGAGVCILPKGSGTGDISGLPDLPTRDICTTLSLAFSYYIKTKSRDPSDSTINFHNHADKHWATNSLGDTEMRVLTAC